MRIRLALIIASCFFVAAATAAAIAVPLLTLTSGTSHATTTALPPSSLSVLQDPGTPTVPEPPNEARIYVAKMQTFATAYNQYLLYSTIEQQEQAEKAEALAQEQREAAQQSSAAAAPSSGVTYDGSGIPAAWQATATCEEGGRDDSYAGYFGILEWNGFDGYPTAGSAPLSVQLAWEAAHGQGPPDAPGQCHSY